MAQGWGKWYWGSNTIAIGPLQYYYRVALGCLGNTTDIKIGSNSIAILLLSRW